MKLLEALVSGLDMHRAGEYEVAWVDGVMDVPTSASRGSVMSEGSGSDGGSATQDGRQGEEGQENEGKEAAAVAASEGASHDDDDGGGGGMDTAADGDVDGEAHSDAGQYRNIDMDGEFSTVCVALDVSCLAF